MSERNTQNIYVIDYYMRTPEKERAEEKMGKNELHS